MFFLQKLHNNKIHMVYYCYYYYLMQSFFDDNDDDVVAVAVEPVMFAMLQLFWMRLNVWMKMGNQNKSEDEMMIILNVMLLLIHLYLTLHDEEDGPNY